MRFLGIDLGTRRIAGFESAFLLLGALLILGANPAVAPFIYTLF